MTSITIASIAVTVLLFAFFNRLIGSGWNKNLVRYFVYPFTSLYAFGLCWLNTGDFNYYALSVGIGYALFRQAGPTISWIAAQSHYSVDWEVIDTDPITRFFVELATKSTLAEIYDWTRRQMRIGGLVGGAFRGLYIIPMCIGSYLVHNSILLLTASILIGTLHGVWHWIFGIDFRKSEVGFRKYAEVLTGATIIATPIWMVIL